MPCSCWALLTLISACFNYSYFNHSLEHAQATTPEPCNSIASPERLAMLWTIPLAMPIWLQIRHTFLLLLQIWPKFNYSCGKKKIMAIYYQVIAWNKHQVGWGSHTYCFTGSCNTCSLHASTLWGPTTHLHHATFWLCQEKPIFNGNFLRNFRQSWAMPIHIIGS